MQVCTPSKARFISSTLLLLFVLAAKTCCCCASETTTTASAEARKEKEAWEAAGLPTPCFFFPPHSSQTLSEVARRCGDSAGVVCSRACAETLLSTAFGSLNASRLPVELIQVCLLEMLSTFARLAQPRLLASWVKCFGTRLWTHGDKGAIVDLMQSHNAHAGGDDAEHTQEEAAVLEEGEEQEAVLAEQEEGVSGDLARGTREHVLSTAASCASDTIIWGVDLRGGRLLSVLDAADAGECCARCHRDTRCQGWSFCDPAAAAAAAAATAADTDNMINNQSRWAVHAVCGCDRGVAPLLPGTCRLRGGMEDGDVEESVDDAVSRVLATRGAMVVKKKRRQEDDNDHQDDDENDDDDNDDNDEDVDENACDGHQVQQLSAFSGWLSGVMHASSLLPSSAARTRSTSITKMEKNNKKNTLDDVDHTPSSDDGTRGDEDADAVARDDAEKEDEYVDTRDSLPAPSPSSAPGPLESRTPRPHLLPPYRVDWAPSVVMIAGSAPPAKDNKVEVPHTESPPELPSEKEDKAEKGLRQGRQRQQQQQQPQPQQPRQRRRQHQPPLARVSKQGIEVYFPEPVASIVSFEGGSATSAGGGTFHENKTEAAVAADAGTPNKTSPAAPKNSSKCAGAPANARLIVGVVFCTVGWAWLFA